MKHDGCNFVYRGPTADIGDLHVRRAPHESGGNVVEVVYELDDGDRRLIAEGGRIRLGIFNEPIPPVSMAVIPESMCRPIGEHPWKTIPELEDPERNGGGS
ncbi:MAG TPA: hypothetical protein VMY78_11865 [Solirubrobacteraceae bacterium]|nr:hypothetical protein [Solirubrobacteraceae bacterium]